VSTAAPIEFGSRAAERRRGSSLVNGAAPLSVAGLSLLLGVVTLGSKALWYDEAFDADAVAGSWSTLIQMVRETEMSQAVYLAMLKTWSMGAGTSEVALRLPSVLAAAVACGVLVALGTRLFDRWTGIVAGLLLATNDFVVQWAQQARTYTLAVLAVVVATWLFVRAVDSDSWWSWLLYALAAAGALYVHFYAGFVIASHAFCLPFVRPRPRLSRVVVAAASVAVLAVPALYFTATAPRYGVEWVDAPSAGSIWRTVAHSSGHNLALLVLAAAGAVLLLRRTASVDRRWLGVLLTGWAVLPIVLGIACSIVQPILVPRYVLVIAPALALLGAHAIVALAPRSPRLVALSCVAVLAASGYWIVHWYGRTPEDWRGAASYVAAEARPGDAVVLAPPWPKVAYRYYTPDRPLASRAPLRRTLVVMRLDRGETPEEVSRRFVDTTRMSRENRRWFGERIAVETWAPS
jgi:mannosyltransferase